MGDTKHLLRSSILPELETQQISHGSSPRLPVRVLYSVLVFVAQEPNRTSYTAPRSMSKCKARTPMMCFYYIGSREGI